MSFAALAWRVLVCSAVMLRKTSGFTLVETMVIVAIIGILATLSVPGVQRAFKRAKAGRFVSDLRVLSGAFEQCRFENKAWPPDENPRMVPPKMVPYLGNFPFTTPTPIGGVWDWDQDVLGVTAGISVDGPDFTPAEMAEMIDAKIDDGDLANGSFRQTAGAIFTHLLEQ